MLLDNVGNMDRGVRMVLGAFLIILTYVIESVAPPEVLGLTFLFVGFVFLATGTMKFCPIYKLLGFSTEIKNK